MNFSRANNRPIQDRFFEKILKTENCWFWIGWRNSSGYGQLNNKNKHVLAHRVSWELHKGTIPEGLCVLHKCDNPICVNPDHLFIGTHKDNSMDRTRKGRNADQHGERSARAKLKEGQVREIICRYKSQNISQIELGKEYQISQQTVSAILCKERWGHLCV